MRRLFLFVSLVAFAAVADAETVKGRIQVVSKQAATVQIDVKGKKVVVRIDADTQFDGAAGLKDLNPPDLIEVEREPGKAATRIKKIVFGLPPGVEISIQELLKIMTGGQAYNLFDARLVKRFGPGHIPSAKPAFPKDANFLSLLPADKNALLVFYCGGPTCPYTGVAVGKAQEAGYTNLKGFQAGMPGWKKSRLPVHSEASWLAKNLNTQHVILDVRAQAASSQSHIQGAVALPVTELQAMTQRFIAEQKVPELPGVTDLRAPIVVYADSHTSREALLAYKELRNWGYNGVTVLNGGMSNWVAAGLPTEQGAAATAIVFEKKLAPGAIAPKEFVALEQSREGVLFVDVRTDQEVATGVIKDARHIPLEQLEDRLAELPKDKEIILYCTNGARAEMAYQTLDKLGFKSRFLNEYIVIDKNGQFKM
jgi:rhodanese-related sulfurtransferase